MGKLIRTNNIANIAVMIVSFCVFLYAFIFFVIYMAFENYESVFKPAMYMVGAVYVFIDCWMHRKFIKR